MGRFLQIRNVRLAIDTGENLDGSGQAKAKSCSGQVVQVRI